MKKIIIVSLFCLFSSTCLAVDYFWCPKDFYGSEWSDLGQEIVADPSNVIVIKWKGNGGDVEVGHDFIDQIRYAQHEGKKVILDLIGNSYSMHSNVICYVDGIITHPHTKFMFHQYRYYGLLGPTYSLPGYIQKLEDEDFTQCTNRGILKPDEINYILSQHGEIYIYSEAMHKRFYHT